MNYIFKIQLLLQILLLTFVPFTIRALEYPGTAPGKTQCYVKGGSGILSNAAIRGEWKTASGRIVALTLENRHTGQILEIMSGHLPRVLLGGGRMIDLVSSVPSESLHQEEGRLVATFRDEVSGLSMRWFATLDDGSNAVIQSLQLSASNDTEIKEIVFIDATPGNPRQVGSVDGSVVVCGDLFMAVEHPLAKNTVDSIGHVRCYLPRSNVLKAGQSWNYSGVFGAVPPGQLRRGFLYYLEKRRAHPYRPFLHYNNWYNVYLSRPVERTNEAECLEAVELFGEKLIRERGVKMDAFVWDDGWDDFNSLWNFHKGFPDGFKNLVKAAGRYGVAQGVWISPWGGYADAKKQRIAYGKNMGYETNASGFSMSGDKYKKAFSDVCLNMMKEHGVVFFKFDGMGGGNKATGATADLADDIDAVLDLTGILRHENPDVFISATVGTWASPFWLKYVCSVWRQGGDNGFYGQGDTRQQWITYRDMNCYERIVKLGPLYPLNSLMLGGIIIGDRRNPAKMVRNEKSIADEIWSFFGSGTCLQELYINPELLTSTMWDELASAAKWSRSNSDVLVDTHWIGSDPGSAGIYGWASWRPGKGIMVLRNPSESTQNFTISPREAFELPEGITGTMVPEVLYPGKRSMHSELLKPDEPFSLALGPFEVVVLEMYDQKENRE